jgi:hypothetical protein
VPSIVTGVAGARRRAELGEYVDTYARLYRTIAAVSGSDVVIDASKSTAQLCALRRIPGLDLRVLHLVRDPRGVAYSWSKAGIVKPQSRDGETMGTYRPHRLALLWSALEVESAALAATAPYAARVRYEDLVSRPRPTLTAALTAIGLPASGEALGHVGDHSVALAPSHGVAGSRSRFTSGRVELQLDDAWRAGLAPGARRIVTAVTFPQLIRYGYVRPGPRLGTDSAQRAA